ncbi:ribonuclease H-like domain-containing protein [Tanacetum coccineum]
MPSLINHDTNIPDPLPSPSTPYVQHPQTQQLSNSLTTNTHHMVTRAKVRISKPLERMNCHVTTTSLLHRSHLHSFSDSNWKKAMVDEYNALISNGMWALVPRPANVNVVRSMWLFRHKFNVDGSLISLVVKLATIRTVLSLAVSRDWPIHQLDVKNALLHDDIILTASSIALLQRIIVLLHSEFAMTDVGSLNYYLGISPQQSTSGLFLSRPKFAEEILERAHMQRCNPCRTHVDTESKLGSDCLSYVVQQLHVSSAAQLTAYTFADWAGCLVTRRSTLGYCVFLGDNLLSWSSKRQLTLSRSSTEAEYHGVTNVVAKTAWLRNLLLELHVPLSTATIVYYDNVSVVYLSTNPVQHQRTKHIEIDIHFVRDYVAFGHVRVLHVPSQFQYADMFTKGLPSALFLEFRSNLNVRRPPAQTTRAYQRTIFGPWPHLYFMSMGM